MNRMPVVFVFIIYLFILFYLAFEPFDFNPRLEGKAWLSFRYSLDTDILKQIFDILQNLSIYLIFGFLFISSFYRDDRILWLFPLGVLSGAGLALFIETMQLFFEQRVSSANDLLWDIIGNFIGCVLGVIIYRKGWVGP